MAQSEKFSDQNVKSVEEYLNIKGKSQLTELETPSLETAITTESNTVDNHKQSIATVPGVRKKQTHSKLCHCTKNEVFR